jgi:gas vesicle protein
VGQHARYEYEEEGFHSENPSECSTSGSSLVWLLVGIGFGAGAALLLTPSAGQELRSAFARGYRRTAEGVSWGTQQLRQHGSNLISFARRSKRGSQ